MSSVLRWASLRGWRRQCINNIRLLLTGKLHSEMVPRYKDCSFSHCVHVESKPGIGYRNRAWAPLMGDWPASRCHILVNGAGWRHWVKWTRVSWIQVFGFALGLPAAQLGTRIAPGLP